MKRKLDFPSLHNADAIVMLTWSDWFHELRSNRYHYATRFARSLPVIFVQPDLAEPTFCFEPTEVENVTVLHVYQNYDVKQSQLLNFALLSVNCIRPLLWIYNTHFHHFIETRYSVLNVYHATEDYLSSDMPFKLEKSDDYANTLSNCQLIISVSDGVRNSLLENAHFFTNHIITISNGCDYQFYADTQLSLKKINNLVNNKKVLYQGNIFGKIDFNLLIELASLMPDWTFQFCGHVVYANPEWQQLLTLPNVEYCGLLSPEELREKCFAADVAIIPFINADYIVARSFPLKVFEYLACGLPVVSSYIDALQPFSEVIQFAKTADEFSIAIQKAALQKSELDILRLQKAAALQDYEIKFSQVVHAINQIKSDEANNEKLTISIIFNPIKGCLLKIMDELQIFREYSKFNFYFIENFSENNLTKLNCSDIIIIHQSISIENNDQPYSLHSKYLHFIEQYGGYKILFYNENISSPKTIEQQIQNLGFHAVFCTEPDSLVKTKYISKLFTGNLQSIQPTFALSNHDLTFFYQTNIALRSTLIGFKQSYLVSGCINFFGATILENLSNKSANKEIKVDLDWHSNKVTAAQWHRFISQCRAIVLFPKESITKEIAAAIHFKVALIFPEGQAPNDFIPYTHYIPLKYDLSNFDELVTYLNDFEKLSIMTSQVFSDFSAGNCSISLISCIKSFDEFISQAVSYKRTRKFQLDVLSTKNSHEILELELMPKPIVPEIVVEEIKVIPQFTPVSYLKNLIPLRVKRKILKLISS